MKELPRHNTKTPKKQTVLEKANSLGKMTWIDLLDTELP